MALNIQDIKTSLNSFFQQIIKNIISLGDDSTLESDLKPIKVGGKVSPVEISETELKITGTINAEAINVKSGTMTSSPGPIPIALSPKYNAKVPLFANTPYLQSISLQSFSQNSFDFGPSVIQF